MLFNRVNHATNYKSAFTYPLCFMGSADVMLGKGELRLQRKVGILFSSKWIDKFIDLGGVNEKLVCLKVLLG